MLESDELLALTVVRLLAQLDAEQPWRRDALCREPAYRTADFYVDGRSPTTAAKAVCARCAVADECAGFELSAGIDEGVWGGLSGHERRVTLHGPNEATGKAPRRPCAGCGGLLPVGRENDWCSGCLAA